MKTITQPNQLNTITMVSKLKVPAYEFSNTINKTAKGSG